MSFRCVDSVGHAVVLVRLRADGCKGPDEPESVCPYIPADPAPKNWQIQGRSMKRKAFIA